MIRTNMEPMKGYASAIITLIASIMVLAAGCGGASVTERLDALNDTYHESVLYVEELTDFLEPLALFNVEDKATFENLRVSLQSCMTATEMAGDTLLKLEAYDYSGDLEPLGVYIGEYVEEYGAGLDELKEVCDYLQSVLKAAEPYMSARATMPQLTDLESLKQWLRPLEELKAACDLAAENLNGVEPPGVAGEYHAFMQELFRVLGEIIDSFILIARGAGGSQDVVNNTAALWYQEVQPRYQGLVDRLNESLRITGIDPFMEAVELEINRLYLGEGGGG